MCRVIDQHILTGKMFSNGHHASGILNHMFRHAFAIRMGHNGNRRFDHLDQHIQMFAQAIRPAPRLAVQVSVSDDEVGPDFLNHIQKIFHSAKSIFISCLPRSLYGSEETFYAVCVFSRSRALKVGHHQGSL